MFEVKFKDITWIFWKKFTLTLWMKLVLVLYITIPLVIKVFPSLLINMVFSHHIHSVVLSKLHKPREAWGVEDSTNYFVKSSTGNMIGIWHIPPQSTQEPLSNAKNVILYCHGKRGHRGSGHRVPFYDVLRKLNFHVIAFDYSGFGDSEGTPDGHTVIEDTVSVYAWSDNIIPQDALLIVWGHSLGSGISAAALSKIQEKGLRHPNGFILESPFTNLISALRTHAVAQVMFKVYPYIMGYIVQDIFEKYELTFHTDNCIANIHSHILLLHAEDDPKCIVEFSEDLYSSIDHNPDKKTQSIWFVRFNKKYDFGHSNIYQSPHLSNIILQFKDKISNDSKLSFTAKRNTV